MCAELCRNVQPCPSPTCALSLSKGTRRTRAELCRSVATHALRQAQGTSGGSGHIGKAQCTPSHVPWRLSKGTCGALCADLESCPQHRSSVLAISEQIRMIKKVPWVYILRCADESFYVGSTRDLESRLQQHAIGCGDAFTKSRRPVALAWAQECEHIEDAYVLEPRSKDGGERKSSR